MKTKILLLLAALSLPLMAERKLTAVWQKYPSPITIIILAEGKEIGRKTTSPTDPGTESETPIVLESDGEVKIVAVAENSLGERSDESEPAIVPAIPKTPKGFKIVVNATITITPTP